MKQLHYPSLFCHTLEIDDEGYIRNYSLRQRDQKRHAVAAVKSLNFHVLAAGDSYNDLSMLQEADAGFSFVPGYDFFRISLNFPSPAHILS